MAGSFGIENLFDGLRYAKKPAKGVPLSFLLRKSFSIRSNWGERAILFARGSKKARQEHLQSEKPSASKWALSLENLRHLH